MSRKTVCAPFYLDFHLLKVINTSTGTRINMDTEDIMQSPCKLPENICNCILPSISQAIGAGQNLGLSEFELDMGHAGIWVPRSIRVGFGHLET